MLLTLQASLFHPILADVDLGRFIVFILAGIFMFVQWLVKLLKEKSDAAERARRVPTEAEEEARRRAWREQTRPVPPPVTTHHPGGGMLEDLIGGFRKALDPA